MTSGGAPGPEIDYEALTRAPFIDPVTGEVFGNIEVPELTRGARGLVRKLIRAWLADLVGRKRIEKAATWIFYLNKVDRHQLAARIAGAARRETAGKPVAGEITDDAVFEEIELFLPKAYLKDIAGRDRYERRSPGSIRFDPYTNRLMRLWAFQSDRAPLRLRREWAVERARWARIFG